LLVIKNQVRKNKPLME
jgi:hypothetical protein